MKIKTIAFTDELANAIEEGATANSIEYVIIEDIKYINSEYRKNLKQTDLVGATEEKEGAEI